MSERPLSVLVVGSLPPPIGGTTVLLEALIRELSDRDDLSVRVVDTSGARGGARGLLRFLGLVVRIVVGALRSDVVCSHVHLSSFHLTVAPALLASRVMRKPLIVRLFGGKDILGEPGPRGAFVRWLAWRVDLLLVETKELIRSARAAGMKHCAWYSNSRPIPDAASGVRERSDRCGRFVFMSQVRESKGIGEILAIAERFGEDVAVDVYGPLMDGPSEADFERSSVVSYKGVAPPQEVTSVLSGYDALLLPTYHDGEGYPGVVLEAFSVGMPVICTHWRALPEIVDATCGLLVTPRDADSLYEAMTRLVSDPELYARLCEGAVARAGRFSSAYWSERFVEYCREVAGRPCSHSVHSGSRAPGESREEATFAFVGDVHFGDAAPPALRPEVADLLAAADFVVANQESPITDLPVCTEDTIGLRSAAGSAGVLSEWGVDAVSLGNNHVFDCGAAGYESTRDALGGAGIRSFGAGRDLGEALEPLEFSQDGVRVHLLSFVEEGTRAVIADAGSHGCAPLREEVAAERIRASAAEADAVLVVVHWGYCDYRMPSPDQARLVEVMLEAGATAVVGHHSHVVQGIWRRGECLVAYSLGNFAFAEYSHGGRRVKLSPDNLRGAVLSVRLRAGEVTGCDIHLTHQNDGAISLDDSGTREAEFVRRCRVLIPGSLEASWKRVVALRFFGRVAHWVNPVNWSGIGRAQIAGVHLMLKEMVRRGR